MDTMQSYRCPQCGHITHRIEAPARPGLRRVPDGRYTVNRYQSGGGAAATGATVAEFVQPARTADLAADVVVPAWQAAISGFALGVLSVPVVVWQQWPGFIPFFVTGGAFAVGWLILLTDHRRSLWQRETYEEENKPEPEPARPELEPARPVGVQLRIQEDKTHMKYAHLPLEIDTLRTVARAIVGGRSFSIGSLTGRGKPLSRSEFETLRDWLFSSGYARWIDADNRAQGVEFTAKGNAFWRALAVQR